MRGESGKGQRGVAGKARVPAHADSRVVTSWLKLGTPIVVSVILYGKGGQGWFPATGQAGLRAFCFACS